MPHQTAPKVEVSARVRKLLEEIARQRHTEYRLVGCASLMLALADGAHDKHTNTLVTACNV